MGRAGGGGSVRYGSGAGSEQHARLAPGPRSPSPAGATKPAGETLYDECPGSDMPHYRYRTATLIGPWRDSILKAETDAVAVGLADFDGPGGRLAWKVPGEIELSADGVPNGASGRAES